MPFTFSHPAIVLPLKKHLGKWVSLSGLIIGSLTPDFEYFIRMKINSNYSHTVIGCFWLNVPLGILLCFIFHDIIKKPLIENLPIFIQKRTLELKELNWDVYFKKKWFVVCCSILIGAFSHILWDSFTHENSFFTNYLKLDKKILSTNIPYFKVLQHLSTLIGGIIILRYFLNLKINELNFKKPRINYWLKISLLTLTILFARVAYGLKIYEYGNIIVSGISAFMISITLISLTKK